jgi:hypothetical protein
MKQLALVAAWMAIAHADTASGPSQSGPPFSGGPSQSGPPPVHVAVIPGIAVNMDSARVDALAQDLALALSGELDVDAIGGLEVRRKLPEDGLPADCVTTPSCVADAARRTGAEQLLFVVMVDTGPGGSIQVDTTWFEPATGKSASRPAIDITTISDAKSRFAAVARQLLPDARVRVKQVVTITQSNLAGGLPRHFTTGSIALAATGVAGLGIGLGFGLATRSAFNTCDQDRLACTQSDRDSIRTKGLVADAGWLAGIGALVASGVLFVTSAEAPHVVVAPAPDGVSAAVFGRF